MADHYGRARVPGPLGVNPGAVGGRRPGPAGMPLWDKKTVAPEAAPTKAVISTTMPPPTKDSDSRDVHEVTWPLFTSKSSPDFREVKQAPNLANCPVPAILAALAFTPTGHALLRGMLSESAGSVSTDTSAAGDLANPPSSAILKTSRYFKVKLPAGQVVVSDVLYTDDHDRGWSPFYMRDPKDKCIWAAIIEKALAAQLGSYENIDALNLTANDFWQKIVGRKPNGFEVKADTALSKITDAAKAAVRVPTMGASRDSQSSVASISPFHGFAMLGMQDSKIRLYDRAKAAPLLVSPAEFRTAFQAVLFK
jgi:hypothetical protein